jgi:hypothetical protein
MLAMTTTAATARLLEEGAGRTESIFPSPQ